MEPVIRVNDAPQPSADPPPPLASRSCRSRALHRRALRSRDRGPRRAGGSGAAGGRQGSARGALLGPGGQGPLDYLMTGLQSARARRQAAARPRQRPRPGLQVGKVGPQGAEQPRKAGLAAVWRRPGVAACACGARPVGIAGRRAQRTLAAAPTATLAMVENAVWQPPLTVTELHSCRCAPPPRADRPAPRRSPSHPTRPQF